jgi:hypothetical protein
MSRKLLNDIPFTLDEKLIDSDTFFGAENIRFDTDGWCYVGKKFAPGAGWWLNDAEGDTAGLKMVCPCGCGAIGAITIDHGGWTWNGNKVLPDLNPSILRLAGCKWHGHLRNGVWKTC